METELKTYVHYSDKKVQQKALIGAILRQTDRHNGGQCSVHYCRGIFYTL